MCTSSGKGSAQHGSDVRYRSIFQRPEKYMSDGSIDRPGFGEIQDVDEIIPPRVEVQRMLIRNKRRGMVRVVLVDSSYFEWPVLESGESCLKQKDPACWGKRSVVDGQIEVKGPERENVQYGLLSGDFARQRGGKEKNTENESRAIRLQCPFTHNSVVPIISVPVSNVWLRRSPLRCRQHARHVSVVWLSHGDHTDMTLVAY